MVAVIIFIPMTIAMLFTEAVLFKIGMDPEAQFDALRGYLNTMNKSSVIMISTIIAALLHLLWCFIFIRVLDLGVRGASIATTITYFL